jgi:hypothetical protein
MNMSTRILFSCVLLSLLSACGGGSGSSGAPAPAAVPTSLSYTDPTGDRWRLVRDASSTDTRLVLNLVGPSNLKSRGVGFNLKRGSGLAFATFSDGAWAHDTGVFQLKGSNSNFESYAGTAADPVLFVSAPLASGDVLSTGIFQKDRTFAAKSLTQPLVQVAITLAPGGPGATPSGPGGDSYALQVVKARMVPDDIGGFDFQLTPTVIAKAKMADIDVAVGLINYK